MRFASAPARPMPPHSEPAQPIQSGVNQMTFKRPTSAGWAVLAIAGLCAVGFVDAALAQTAAPAAPAAADAAAAPAAAASVPNKGDTAWMLVSSALVLMMSIPGLALFYGGLVRTKNMASDPDPGVRDRRHGRRGLDPLRLFARLRRRRQHDALYRRFRQGVPAWGRCQFDGGDLLQRRRDSGILPTSCSR